MLVKMELHNPVDEFSLSLWELLNSGIKSGERHEFCLSWFLLRFHPPIGAALVLVRR